MIFTVIQDAISSNKKLLSKDSINFINVDISLDKAHNIFHDYFVLSRPLKNSVRNKRDSTLESLYRLDVNYVIVDLDKVVDRESIINYFKNNNYTINLFESRNNLKAIVEVDFITSRVNIEAFLTMLDEHLQGLCEVDVSSARNASYQAPTKKQGYLLLQYGIKVELDTIKNYITEHKPITEYNDINSRWFWDKFIQDYNMVPKEYYNQNGTIQCSLPTEQKTKFSYYWNKDIPWLLQHPNKNKTINIFNDFINSDEGKEYIKNKRSLFFKEKFNIQPNISINNNYFNLSDDIKNIVDASINDKKSILVIKGVMGSGKSNIIEYIKKPRILYISMRRSLSYDIKEKYKCKHYLENLNHFVNKDTYRPGDSLVVQIDSLYKINPNYFDYVVIDEFESFCLYTQNNMVNSCDYYMKNMYIIKELFNNKNIIIADAFINNFSLDLYFSDRKKYIISNEYKDNSQVYIYEHKHTFISMIEQVCYTKKDDEIVSCSFGTLNEMKTIKKMLEDKNLKVLSLDSSTSDDVKELASSMFKMRDVNSYDVIMFSPTITVGISILNNITHHFHFDSGKSIDVISSVQMTKRARLAKHIHVFLAGNRKSKIYDINILDNELVKSIDTASNIELFNYDTKELSNIGKFINKFVAHNNFYTGDTKNIIKFLLSQQFLNIINIKEKLNNKNFEKIKKQISESNNIIINKSLDMQDYDYNYSKKNLDEEEKTYQEALALKDELYMLEDNVIVDILKYKKNIKNKIRYLLFFIKSKEQKDFEIKKLILSSLKNIIVDQEYINNLKILSKYDFRLMEFYTKKEVYQFLLSNNDFTRILNLIGYKKKFGGYKIDGIFKKILSTYTL